MFLFKLQKEFTNDCVFNERMQAGYNYYTSTHHSTAAKSFYIALNRMGGPRKTHIPTNKAFGSLFTYIKSVTLTVPEQRSDALIANVFGANHVKHGLKHLCLSNKALHNLTANQMITPTCNDKKSIASVTQTSSRSKRPPAPAAIVNRKKNSKCTQEPCPKKKKKQQGKHMGHTSIAPDVSVLTGHAEPSMSKTNATKQKRKPKHKHKNRKQQMQTTTETTTTSTTNAGISVDENLISDDDDDDEIPSTGATAFSNDADDDYGYDS